MFSPPTSPIARVRTSFDILTVSATELNAMSDRLGTVVARIDSSFHKLNLGITAWVRFHDLTSEDGLQNWFKSVGYAKVNGKWGLAIKTGSEHKAMDTYVEYEEWLFNDAPRALRIEAIDKLPDLFDKLTQQVGDTTKQIDAKLRTLEEFADAIDPKANAPGGGSNKRVPLDPAVASKTKTTQQEQK